MQSTAVLIASIASANGLVERLEGRKGSSGSTVGSGEGALDDAIEEFDNARRHGVQFLLDTGESHAEIFGGVED